MAPIWREARAISAAWPPVAITRVWAPSRRLCQSSFLRRRANRGRSEPDGRHDALLADRIRAGQAGIGAGDAAIAGADRDRGAERKAGGILAGDAGELDDGGAVVGGLDRAFFTGVQV